MIHLASCRVLAALLVSLAGCSEDAPGEDAGPPDAGSPDAGDFCPWPIESATPGGSVELGIVGDSGEFVPLPDEVPFHWGLSAGSMLLLQARIDGLEPGDPDDFLASRNPRTRFTATLMDGTPIEQRCASTQGYVSSARDGTFERKQRFILQVLPTEVAVAAFRTFVTLKVEVIDADGRYASDEREVFCPAPSGSVGPYGRSAQAVPPQEAVEVLPVDPRGP